ncbi:MAG: lysophospholipid acyltransferase family protein [Spirulina sp.]
MALASSPLSFSPNAVSPLALATGLLGLSGVSVTVTGQDRIPPLPLVLVSNHRSIMDALLLMQAVNRPVRFACHHYMGQVPGLREVVQALGCLPLDPPGRGQRAFFRRALHTLGQGESVGIFPEGAAPMVQSTTPQHLGPFHRGFAHLALRAPVEELVIVPVAIASRQEWNNAVMPLRWLSWFDATEPLFQQPGLHPAVVYRRVDLRIGRPIRVNAALRGYYRRKGHDAFMADITHGCHEEIATLLQSSTKSSPTPSP